MKLANKQNPKKQTSLIATLTAYYGDEQLAKIVELAKQVPSTASFAKHVQVEQIQRWLERGRTPKGFLQLLNLDYGLQMLTKPQVNAWVKYTDAYNKQHPDAKVTLLSTLKGFFSEKTLVNMLIAAKNTPSAEAVAVRVQAEQTRLWLLDGRSPDSIFTLLQMKKAKEGTLLQNPLFGAWVKYADDFNLMHPLIEQPALSTLTKYFSIQSLAKMNVEASKNPSTVSLANRIDMDIFQKWSVNGDTPAKVFTKLKLNKARGHLFENPLLATWLKYITYFRDTHRTERVNLLSILQKHFNDAALAKMLIEAEKTSSTKTLASDLMDDLLIRWMSNEVEPKKVYSWLRVEGATESGLARGLYDKYMQYYKHHYERQ